MLSPFQTSWHDQYYPHMDTEPGKIDLNGESDIEHNLKSVITVAQVHDPKSVLKQACNTEGHHTATRTTSNRPLSSVFLNTLRKAMIMEKPLGPNIQEKTLNVGGKFY